MIRYRLTIEIHGLRYLLRLAGHDNDSEFSLSFKTLEYEYATVGLDEGETERLFKNLADFLESAYEDSGKKILSIEISPADAPYSTLDIERCIKEIMENSNEYSEEVLRKEYKGFKIFDLYYELFNKDFTEMNRNTKSKALSRSRYFKVKCAKVLLNWEIKETYKGSVDFSLERKERENISLSS